MARELRVQVGRMLRPRHGAVEAAALVTLYGIYELTRGTVDGSWTLARAHAAEIVRVERELGMFWEWDVQRWAQALPGVPALLGLAYVVLHVVCTIAALVWVHRRHREQFALLRTVLVAASGLALIVYIVYPALMLFVIVATGNHFWIDAAAGLVVAAAAWVLARALLQEAPEPVPVPC